jgi:hypothetical protein
MFPQIKNLSPDTNIDEKEILRQREILDRLKKEKG